MTDQQTGRPPHAAPNDPDELSTSLADVRQLGLFAAIASLGYVFWVVGAMEMVERLAFYGVRQVSSLYATDPRSAGGLGVTMADVGILFATWAFVQSLVPAFTGGLSDRYGYQRTIFASTVLKIAGYLLMAWFPTFAGFFCGAIVLALGTAIFKPGIQGTLVRCTTRRNSSVAWGIFYQTVNIGGAIGPILAGYLRKLEWSHVFYACAAIISLNFLLLLTYREVGLDQRLAREAEVRTRGTPRPSLWRESLVELRRPHVAAYLIIMSGFWFTLYGLFDLVTVHVDEWVDTRPIVRTFFESGRSDSKVFNLLAITDPTSEAIQPEGIININSLMIMLVCFVVAGITARFRATASMAAGLLCIAACWLIFTQTFSAWMIAFAIVVFSLGEMLTSPKFSEFIGNFAPHDKKAMYLGFSQIPIALGWTVEGYLGPWLYDRFSSRERFAREALTRGLADRTLTWPADTIAPNPQAFVDTIPQGEAFDRLVELTGRPEWTLARELADAHPSISYVWWVMAAVAVGTALAIQLYGLWIRPTTTASATPAR